ncbi:hypothetical protein AB685_01890 [Bacillus sp. LL01]|uniref:DUF4397 domain-containing protein n=1 Tax=Bacillus sp. LL01 TaxID=1665556 RepID=UPI00064CEC8D|nr:DUF4397 domain-containing protein [Bacillus sp. LL01]KMJ59649.1 hypothetical protein AB685_01890 [Bacillus sp. LL01]
MSNDDHFFCAVQYQMLADYFKYVDPEKHIYFYKLHFLHIQKWLYYGQNREKDNSNPGTLPKIRFLHASPGTPDLDVIINNTPVLRDLRYTNSSGYIESLQTDMQISINQSRTTGSPLLSGFIQLSPDTAYTLAIAGSRDKLQFIVIEDEPSLPQSESKLRFWHLSPDAPSVDIAVKKGDVVFSDISFTELSEYLGLTPMTADLEVKLAGTKDVVLPLNRVSLKPDLAYTIVAVGLVDGNPGLEAIFLVP